MKKGILILCLVKWQFKYEFKVYLGCTKLKIKKYVKNMIKNDCRILKICNFSGIKT